MPISYASDSIIKYNWLDHSGPLTQGQGIHELEMFAAWLKVRGRPIRNFVSGIGAEIYRGKEVLGLDPSQAALSHGTGGPPGDELAEEVCQETAEDEATEKHLQGKGVIFFSVLRPGYISDTEMVSWYFFFFTSRLPL